MVKALSSTLTLTKRRKMIKVNSIFAQNPLYMNPITKTLP